MATIRLLSLTVLAAFCAGCGSGESAKTAQAGDAGAYVQDVEKAKSVANEASDKIRTGEREVYGDK